MDETAFEFDSQKVAETSRRFPARRLASVPAGPVADLDYLVASAGAEFSRHAWDEAGQL